MESLAQKLAGAVANLPGVGMFLAVAAAILLGIAAAFFLARRAAPVAFLARQADRFLAGFVAFVLLVMVFLSALQIVMRNFFDSGLLWIDPLLRHLVLVLAFAGAIIATGLKRHVQIDVLGRLLQGKASRVAGAIVAGAAGTVCLALAHASLDFLRDELEFGEILFLNIPSWSIVSVFPVAFLTLAFRFFYLVFLELADEAPRAVGGTSA